MHLAQIKSNSEDCQVTNLPSQTVWLEGWGPLHGKSWHFWNGTWWSSQSAHKKKHTQAVSSARIVTWWLGVAIARKYGNPTRCERLICFGGDALGRHISKSPLSITSLQRSHSKFPNNYFWWWRRDHKRNTAAWMWTDGMARLRKLRTHPKKRCLQRSGRKISSFSLFYQQRKLGRAKLWNPKKNWAKMKSLVGTSDTNNSKIILYR